MVNDSNIITIDSIESKMKVNKFSGNHSQKTREGYNVLQNKLTSNTINGVTFTINEDKSVTLNGTATNSIITNLITGKYDDNNATNPLIIPENITNYRLSGCPSGGSWSTYKLDIYAEDNELIATDLGEGANIQKESDTILNLLRVRIIVYAGAVLNNVTFYPMIIYGAENKPYEEYGAMPSLDYPSEVKAVGDNVNIFPDDLYNYFSSNQNAIKELNGKEFKITTIANRYSGIYLNSNNDFYKDLTNKIKEKIVTYSFDVKADSDIQLLFGTTGYKTIRNVNNNWQRLQVTYEKNEPGIYFYNSSATVTTFYIRNIKLIFGEGDNSYSPHGQGSVEVKKINKNLLPQVEIGDINTTTGQDVISSNVLRSDFISVSYNNTYVWSANRTLAYGKPNLRFYNKDKKYLGYGNFTGNTYTVNDKDIAFIRIRMQLSAEELSSFDELKFQIEIGNSASDFVEHQEQSYILDIQKPMLLGDYFVKEADGWKEVHIWNKLIFTGQENWNKSGASTDEIFVATLDIENGVDGYGYSNYFRYYGYVEIGCFSVYNNGANIRFCVDSSVISDINRFKTMLADKYASGDSVYVYYKLSTPNKLACTEAQITVLNQLQNIILYDDTTNIILPDVYPILDYDVSKIIDTTTTFEASLDSNGYFVVPDYDIKCLISYSESDIPSMPEAVETSVNIPGRDGDIPLNTTYSPLTFTIVCYTEDNLTPEEKNIEESKMNNFLHSIKNNITKLKYKDKYYNVKYSGQLTTINYPKHLQFTIPLKSSSSYAKNIEEYYILGNGEKESNTIKEVGAVFVIDGPAQTPKISLNDYEMFYDNVLLSNTKLVIDSNKSTVTMINREGTETNAMRYYNHEFPKIQNGNNVLKVLSGIDEERQVSVRWFDLKL